MYGIVFDASVEAADATMDIKALPEDLRITCFEFFLAGVRERALARRRVLKCKQFILSLCRGDRAAHEYLIYWLADVLQCPMTKPRRAMALIGHTRDFLDLLSQLVSIAESHNFDRGDWRSDPSFERAEVLVVHQPVSLCKISELMGADYISITRRNQPCRIVRSFHRVLIVSERALEPGNESVEVILFPCANDNNKTLTPVPQEIQAFRDWLMSRVSTPGKVWTRGHIVT